VFEPLTHHFKVFAPDMLGHGDSDKPSNDYLIEDYAQSIIDFMDHLRLEQAIFCGNSVGALVAIEIACSYPERVKKIILVGCPARGSWEKMEKLFISAQTFDSKGIPRPYSLTDLEKSFAFPSKELLDWFNYQREKAGIWVKKTLIAIALYDIFSKLPLIKCPTLIIYGTRDLLKDKEADLLKNIENSQSVTIKDAGHIPQYEKPLDFLTHVNRFLNIE